MNRIIGTYETNNYIVEYSKVGNGTPVLIVHGGHSNCYEEFGYAPLLERGFQLVTPSRAGYGLTTPAPLEKAVGRYAELLDHLGIDRVHVIGISAGGPTAVKFAGLFPEKVRTLTLQSAVVGKWLTAEHTEYKTSQVIFRPPFEWLTWKLLSVVGTAFPRLSFRPMFFSLSTLTYAEGKHLVEKEDIEEVRKMNCRQRSGTGFLMDLKSSGMLTEKDLSRISCPVLIQASLNDRSVSTAHAYFAKAHIPSAALKLYNTWGHLIWLGRGSEQVHRDAAAFLKADGVIT
ncbi:alpha/beta hydrolase [Domibacillus sp. DTU_2020_1001157_1_SI_ALB_TIR_016]|uniref:alpha/beta fold hydrolase n=1 Tax=Domibacillus sp. DTU_2020_1001157_1_SI_ALB_TIR_016 TaxID=3077789 RepID=UPI0028EDD60D|nr:alpha/beta hydrolase [Domibacillus sp. DTU_2020_1001157_1_SI_ALB_TIR_016]WNS81504.1 alpha/beta hydrolase [Domibacillus sp. DTU_2020_1001157_1_SI_ALB_TIR_016]